MPGRRLVELSAGRIALLSKARDEDLGQGNPAPGIGRPGALPEVREDVPDVLHVRDALLELVHRRARRMDVGIDQPRQHRPAAEIDLLRVRAGEFQDVGVRAHRDDAPGANRHGLDSAKLRINGHDLAGVKDVARRGFALIAGCDNERQKDVGQVAVHRQSPQGLTAAHLVHHRPGGARVNSVAQATALRETATVASSTQALPRLPGRSLGEGGENTTVEAAV